MPKKKKTYEDFLNGSIKEKVLRNRILVERPYLVDYDNFKSHLIAYQGFKGNEEEAERLYDKAFSDAAKEERIPQDVIVSQAELWGDSESTAERSFKSLMAFYGAKPKFVKEWAKNVCIRDKFTEALPEIKLEKEPEPGVKVPGSFSSDEFGVISYLNSMNPEVIKGYRDQKDSGINHDSYISYNSMLWASNATSSGKPRDNTVNHFGLYAMKQAREETVRLIAEYDKGNIEPLAEKIKTGIQISIKDSADFQDLNSSSTNYVIFGKMLKETNKLLEAKPELKEKVMASLTEEEKQKMQSIILVSDLLEQRELALLELGKVENKEVVHTEEEILNYKKTILAANDVADRWLEKRREVEQSQEHLAHKEEYDNKVLTQGTGTDTLSWNHDFTIVEDQKKHEAVAFAKEQKDIDNLIESKAEEAKTFNPKPESRAKKVTPEKLARMSVQYTRGALEASALKLQEKAHAADGEFDKEFAALKKNLGKQRAGSDAYKEAKEKMDIFVDGRIRELEDSYQKREISEHYFRERANQLNALKQNPTRPAQALPEFKDPENDEKNKTFLENVFLKENGYAFGEHLKDVATFALWRVEESRKIPGQEIELDEFDDEKWELMYQNEISRAAEKNPLPKPELLILPHTMTDEEKAALNHDAQDKEISDEIVKFAEAGKPVQKNDEQYKPKEFEVVLPEMQRKVSFSNLKISLPDYIEAISAVRHEESESSAQQVEKLENDLCLLIAKNIAIGMIERRNGKVPGGMTDTEFSKKMAAAPGFREVVKPLIEEVCDQYEEMKAANPEVASNSIPKAQRLLEMVEDRSILSAFGLQQKLDKEAAKTVNKANQPAAEGNAPKPESSALKHAKTQLKQEPKKPEPKKPEGGMKL